VASDVRNVGHERAPGDVGGRRQRKEGSVGFASLGEGGEFVCLSVTPSISSGRAI
jgi:hypothetical protein